MANIIKRKGKRGMSYRVQVRRNGVSKTKTFPNKADAEQWACYIEGNLKEMKFSGHFQADRYTVAAAITEFEHRAAKTGSKLKLWDDKRRLLVFWSEVLGDTRLSELTAPLIENELDKLLEGGRTGATVNRYRAALSSVLKACAAWGWVTYNPVRLTTKSVESPGRTRYLSSDERERLLAACRDSRAQGLETFVVTALFTGARKGELQKITWDNIDLKKAEVEFVDTKNGTDRVVPLHPEAVKVLREWAKIRRIDSPLVFPSENQNHEGGNDYREGFENAAARAGLKDFRFHDLRHTAGTELTKLGLPLNTVADILGHKTLEMSKRYAHSTKEVKQAAIKGMYAE